MERWGIIGAMEPEVARLIEELVDARQTVVAGVTVTEGTLRGRPVAVAKSGIGKVCAALCTQLLIDRFGARAIVNTGIAGGLHPSLRVGDFVVGTDAVQHDVDVRAFGYPRGCLPGGAERDVPTRFWGDPRLLAAFRRAAAATLDGDCRVLEGTIASGDVFVHDRAQKHDIADAFGACAVEMEGAAIAQVAAANGIPCLLVRAISDLADEGAPVVYDQFEQEAAARCARLVIAMAGAGE